MDNIRLISLDSSEDSSIRRESIKNLINDESGDISLNLLFDIFQNLILDCKSVVQNHNNRYFVNLYKLYKTINNRLYELRLNSDDFYTLKVIGQGAFGQVQLVRHRQTKSLYAMKILNKTQMMSQEGSVFWKEERDIMTGIDSRWIVKLHYAFQDPKRLFMVMEYLPGGNLVNWMSKLEDVFEPDVCFYAAEIVLALCVLHDYNFVHRDIKPDNMLLDCRGHIKLADFGTCVRIDPVTKHITCNRAVGTPDYISPEVLQSQNGNTGYGREVDWWSLGVMLYEIFYGDPPFYSENLVQTYGKIMVHEQYLTFPPDEQISGNAVSLIRGLICDRSVRLGQSDGAFDIKSHAFFKHQNNRWNWENIHEYQAPFIPELENELDTTNFDCQDDNDSKELFNNNDKELTSNVFYGENLQFSGFSYGDIFNEPKPKLSKTSPVLTEKLVDESVNNIIAENQHLTSKIHCLGKENQDIKSVLEKLSIERKDLETQIQGALMKLKTEISISKKLQTDYSDLMYKHGMCQQKFSKLEEEKHKLCADLASLQYKKMAWRLFNCTRPMSRYSDETVRLHEQIEAQKTDIDSINGRLSETVIEFRKSKLENVRLENEVKYLLKRCENLEQEMVNLQSQSDKGDVTTTNSQTIFSAELKELKQNYDDKWRQLQQQLTENETLSQMITDLQKDNDTMRQTLTKAEEENGRNKISIGNFNILIKEKNSIIEDQKTKLESDRIKIDAWKQMEKDLNVKILRLSKQRSDEKQKFDYELEDQRMKLNSVITNKVQEVQLLSRNIETAVHENASLKSDLQLEKAKCSGLVEKINDILTGKSATAREMMLAEEMKSGKVDKRSGRFYNQALKENKRLQSLYNQLEKDSARKEKEYKFQIETLAREKEHLENENGCLKNNVAYYENIGLNESTANRASVITYSSHGSYDSGFTVDAIKATSTPVRIPIHHPKPPLFNVPLANISHMSPIPKSSPSVQLRNEKEIDITIRQNKIKTLDSTRLSISDSLLHDFPCPEGQLDVNVKVKGKKMSWEKRFVKLEGQNLLFYNQSLENCLLKLPLSCLVFVRQATTADIIHAKKGEIPRIFQICYDKNRTIYSEVMMKQSMSGSNCSVNTVGSSKSSSKESVVTDLNDIILSDMLVMKQDHRKGSVSKFLFGSKKATKADHEELTINSLPLGSVFLKGHIFQICTVDSKNNCDMCKKSLQQPIITSSTINCGQRVVTTELSSRLMSSGTLPPPHNRTMDTLSSTVDVTKTYKCYHCAMNVHGTDLDDKIMSTCKESVAIQLCRTSSEQQLSEWVSCLSNAIKYLHNVTVSTPSTSRADFKTRSATLG